jgi:hypothetical protein
MLGSNQRPPPCKLGQCFPGRFCPVGKLCMNSRFLTFLGPWFSCSVRVRPAPVAAQLQHPTLLDHLVTQWMSVVISSEDSSLNSSHVHFLGSSTAPTTEKSHSSSGVCGVRPVERTGKPSTRYLSSGLKATPFTLSSRVILVTSLPLVVFHIRMVLSWTEGVTSLLVVARYHRLG